MVPLEEDHLVERVLHIAKPEQPCRHLDSPKARGAGPAVNVGLDQVELGLPMRRFGDQPVRRRPHVQRLASLVLRLLSLKKGRGCVGYVHTKPVSKSSLLEPATSIMKIEVQQVIGMLFFRIGSYRKARGRPGGSRGRGAACGDHGSCLVARRDGTEGAVVTDTTGSKVKASSRNQRDP